MMARIGAALAVIAAGLALRGVGPNFGLPGPVVKYGGSILWGTMVFLLIATVARDRPRWQVALVSIAIAVGVELFRLVHAPWLDEFRMTLAGALLLGRIFSPWNIAAYAAGIMLGIGLDILLPRPIPYGAR